MRHAPSTRALNDPTFGMGRQPVTTLTCAGCARSLRRSARKNRGAQIVLCPPCTARVTDQYEARIRAAGIVPSVLPGAGWLPAWERLRQALRDGDRAFLGDLLPAQAGTAA